MPKNADSPEEAIDSLFDWDSTAESTQLTPLPNPRNTWAEASSNSIVGQWIDKYLGLQFVSMTPDEIIKAANNEFSLEDYLEFRAIKKVSALVNDATEQLSGMQLQTGVLKNLNNGADITKLNTANKMLNKDANNNTVTIFQMWPPLLSGAAVPVVHVCPYCENEFRCDASEKGTD